MNLKNLQKNWEIFGKTDPLWAVLTEPDKINNQWEESAFFKTGKDEVRAVLALAQAVKPVTFNSVLDFGCGVGRLSQAFCEYFDQVNGVDISSTMLQKANAFNKFANKCRYFHNTQVNLSVFQTNRFDFIYSNITLQHMPAKFALAYISEFVRVLKPNGLMVFSIPAKPPFYYWLFYNLLSQKIINLLVKIKGKKDGIMEMHWVKKERVIHAIEKSGGRILNIMPDYDAGKNWVGYRYFATK